MQADPKGVLTGAHFLDGDHACCEGALAAGCRFVAGYPLTPSPEVVERIAKRSTVNRDRVSNILGYLDECDCIDTKYSRAVRIIQKLAEREIGGFFQPIAEAIYRFNNDPKRLEDPKRVVPFDQQWEMYLAA